MKMVFKLLASMMLLVVIAAIFIPWFQSMKCSMFMALGVHTSADCSMDMYREYISNFQC